MSEKKKDELGYTPKTRTVADAEEEAAGLSSEIFDVIDLRGKTSKPGPSVARCSGQDEEKFYKINHAWSLWGVPVKDMKQAMARLKEDLPQKGWKIVKYGPDKSPSKSPELIADSIKKQFSVSIHLYDESDKSGSKAPKSLIYVLMTSNCFQVPDGQTVDEY
ncbi:hypothetical protein [Streptomyces sp. PSAA01]|uniref:hypothetical protein n=1 Tax=Streptomyces sp. PSAA01 TaxID=2912762 RepID=UPI001F2E0F0C|nr:hypothetical protein [Streptomyces sp. PSAA01]MCG0288525.1 hypothetical protein [Streptomyces sp. PSAA01]